ncbi:hypothetical protein D3C80_1238440 [compost metagenome]
MQGQCGDLARVEHRRDFLALQLGMAEHHTGGRTEVQQQAGHRLHALVGVDLVEALLDLAVVVLRLQLDALRLAHEARGQLLDAFRVGGGEQQGLPLGRGLLDDLADRVDKAHVEHAVGFVEDQVVEAVELEGALAQVFEDAPRGADDDMRAMLQRADLRAEGHAAAQGQHLDVVGAARQQADFLGHLVGQFAGRAQHQRLAAEVALIERR